MDHIDEFESIFRRADKATFEYHPPQLERIALVTDSDAAQQETLKQELIKFLPTLSQSSQFQLLGPKDFENVGDLLNLLRSKPVDLIVTYRHLREEIHIPQHSLGVYVDVLTQAVASPVLLLPGTSANPISLAAMNCEDVMVVTEHIAGDHRLINYGAICAPAGGQLLLVHIEDDVVFERYMEVIERIPEIDSAVARESISQQLLQDALDYQQSCNEAIKSSRDQLIVHPIARRGHRLRDFQSLIDEQDVDLLVMNTKDDEQLAMHGLAYSLSVELQELPLLLV
ncbi:hypothetical protein Pla110_22960 [Polystyrenella longa]|uniref:Universal stress protein family protein n=1 Tax=Polystyrenella longa TaxID=2528007 RepID=A0A518CMX0_9PLAN|nr:hypothetical protein [Polystyrenella longa]QDU80565.1 hypothetical protein Pla110_22960 [Polystyrenella longa]